MSSRMQLGASQHLLMGMCRCLQELLDTLAAGRAPRLTAGIGRWPGSTASVAIRVWSDARRSMWLPPHLRLLPHPC